MGFFYFTVELVVVALLYPDTVQNYQNEAAGFTIRDEFADQVDVKITAWQLPVINRELMDGDLVKGKKLDEVFEDTKNLLEGRINEMLYPPKGFQIV